MRGQLSPGVRPAASSHLRSKSFQYGVDPYLRLAGRGASPLTAGEVSGQSRGRSPSGAGDLHRDVAAVGWIEGSDRRRRSLDERHLEPLDPAGDALACGPTRAQRGPGLVIASSTTRSTEIPAALTQTARAPDRSSRCPRVAVGAAGAPSDAMDALKLRSVAASSAASLSTVPYTTWPGRICVSANDSAKSWEAAISLTACRTFDEFAENPRDLSSKTKVTG